MSARVPDNREVAHAVLDLIDRVQPLKDALQHPDAVENELAVLTASRVDLSLHLEAYADLLEMIVVELVDPDVWAELQAERYGRIRP